MSAKSLRARLDAATPGSWHGYGFPSNGPRENIETDANLIAHAPTDLRLALDVIEAAKRAIHPIGRIVAPGDDGVVVPTYNQFEMQSLEEALDAFETSA